LLNKKLKVVVIHCESKMETLYSCISSPDIGRKLFHWLRQSVMQNSAAQNTRWIDILVQQQAVVFFINIP